ncbi:hypothetical protein Kpol_269p2 [Vanderwaltozyma polyspora DSM 70294]|uniref:Uncharacterized protein n=1 Tax=Vanderwaltozyma polyspora (strain ATCC 22028 / DSM 70294 / BCRC 21397 / CBS 2163 / NBRC 10782 / NRRL Y-8283 / UCD 57-17) TaxID=436907 RepID=A7TT33_VANPO|nr:uncharacterized protein Kpol_269p2 [Vanderwaltozyma polyspora DSM 70294]EDO14569.1 hypothetical protein Kpol_269p2 [Vanderwaltozyma polyspora DSM 70294]
MVELTGSKNNASSSKRSNAEDISDRDKSESLDDDNVKTKSKLPFSWLFSNPLKRKRRKIIVTNDSDDNISTIESSQSQELEVNELNSVKNSEGSNLSDSSYEGAESSDSLDEFLSPENHKLNNSSTEDSDEMNSEIESVDLPEVDMTDSDKSYHDFTSEESLELIGHSEAGRRSNIIDNENSSSLEDASVSDLEIKLNERIKELESQLDEEKKSSSFFKKTLMELSDEVFKYEVQVSGLNAKVSSLTEKNMSAVKYYNQISNELQLVSSELNSKSYFMKDSYNNVENKSQNEDNINQKETTSTDDLNKDKMLEKYSLEHIKTMYEASENKLLKRLQRIEKKQKEIEKYFSDEHGGTNFNDLTVESDIISELKQNLIKKNEECRRLKDQLEVRCNNLKKAVHIEKLKSYSKNKAYSNYVDSSKKSLVENEKLREALNLAKNKLHEISILTSIFYKFSHSTLTVLIPAYREIFVKSYKYITLDKNPINVKNEVVNRLIAHFDAKNFAQKNEQQEIPGSNTPGAQYHIPLSSTSGAYMNQHQNISVLEANGTEHTDNNKAGLKRTHSDDSINSRMQNRSKYMFKRDEFEKIKKMALSNAVPSNMNTDQTSTRSHSSTSSLLQNTGKNQNLSTISQGNRETLNKVNLGFNKSQVVSNSNAITNRVQNSNAQYKSNPFFEEMMKYQNSNNYHSNQVPKLPMNSMEFTDEYYQYLSTSLLSQASDHLRPIIAEKILKSKIDFEKQLEKRRTNDLFKIAGEPQKSEINITRNENKEKKEGHENIEDKEDHEHKEDKEKKEDHDTNKNANGYARDTCTIREESVIKGTAKEEYVSIKDGTIVRSPNNNNVTNVSSEYSCLPEISTNLNKKISV